MKLYNATATCVKRALCYDISSILRSSNSYMNNSITSSTLKALKMFWIACLLAYGGY